MHVNCKIIGKLNSEEIIYLMVILGLHFGHDAGIAVLKNGKAICNLIRERYNRAKHSFGINVSHIEEALNYLIYPYRI